MSGKARERKRVRPANPAPDSSGPEPSRRKFAAGLVALGFAGLVGLGGLLHQRKSSDSGSESVKEPTLYTYRVVNKYKHDPEAFTQGLLWSNGSLFESTGLYGRSSLRELQLGSGGEVHIVRQLQLDRRDFGEGLVQRRGQFLQLLWRTGKGIRYEAQAGKDGRMVQSGTFRTPLGDGWGIEFDGEQLIVTDSGHDMIFLDAEDFSIKNRVSVTDDGKFIEMINELEMIGNELWANIYGTDCLARIDKTSGSVTGWLVLQGILDRQSAAAEAKAAGREGPDVLNGIAWDPEGKRIFVTGKLWPEMYEIKLEPANGLTLERARRVCIPRTNIFRPR